MNIPRSANSVQANVGNADVKARCASTIEPCRNYIGAGTSEIRCMLIGRELFRETA
jgi:hypothetical protein